jgi:DNA-binding transcriptional MerR regulator
MLTIGQLAAYAGVTARTVRHYHQIGLLPEPERDASGYRQYGATAVVSLIRIRILANAGVPLSQIGQMLEADAPAFAEAVQRIDSHLRDEIERLETSRKQIAQLAAGDSLALPPEVISYLDRLREIGASERMLESERDGWILIAARWPDHLPEVMTAKLAQLEDPQLVRLYRVLSELLESDVSEDDPRLKEAVDILVGLLEQADTSGELDFVGVAPDDLAFDLLDALAVEYDPRTQRMVDLLRKRGWTGWNRPERLAEPPTELPGSGDFPELRESILGDLLERCLVRVVDPLLEGDVHDGDARPSGEGSSGVAESPCA